MEKKTVDEILTLWSLFFLFFVIGFVSFGGGYAIIPVIEQEALRRGWMTTQQLTDIIAIAGMSPGPIATNFHGCFHRL
ncbi:chromate transporter [Sporosarcina sp. 179-K 3D1 HS]|uniref:chromate transporter n=1 Tax=Sporosarcina sp. 179-K 3D1 HS TaxID=3232169 RepID=UPI0039A027BB